MNNISNGTFVNFNALNELMIQKGLKSHEKLSFMYEQMGGMFYDDDKQIMKNAVVGITSIGGFPVELSEKGSLIIFNRETSIEELKAQLFKTVGMSSFMSYFNPKNKRLDEVANAALNLQHFSCLHTVQISVLVCGLTSGVEHEFSSQRDIMHLSRLTVAKTVAQSNPCLVLHNENYYQHYRKVLDVTKSVLKESSDDIETRNLLFPGAKASAIMLTGTLKNFLKLVALKDSGGKEDEFVNILQKLEKQLKQLFPEII